MKNDIIADRLLWSLWRCAVCGIRW